MVSIFLLHCVHHQVPTTVTRDPAALDADNKVQRYAFEQCTSESRLYLEDQILRMPEVYYRSHQNEWTQRIPMSCFQFAQKNYGGAFAQCADEDAKPTTNARRPCMTEIYVTLAYNAYHDVMDCFSLDPKDYFLQIMIESGFHINAINRTGFDAGMAQFTANGIKKVLENNQVQRVRNHLFSSSRPSCSRISSIMGDFDIESHAVKNRCAMIATPQNPYRSMFFYFLHRMSDQIVLSDMLSEISDLNGVMSERLKKHLTYLAYNRGLTGTKRILKGYIESRRVVGHQIVPEDFDLEKNLSAIKKILRMDSDKRDQLRSAKRIKNLSFAEYAVIHGATYVSDMAAANQMVRRYLGDQCGGL
ncbi:MAG: hypothetical protein A2622_06265 [Bdellovibrionales bacterium RIFCSPHIGHO2_01_FULL_40_29]|nr:MAG: hypothetical protein A2622_06265 [Bdellovibrionales bacterium RIFCSPHIGHO2_01_FULL_40_29]OFZ35051.1 MAG: hypothetical protein A3D17_06615 [Bdellovibrionales bacterium RIFCSPHIGHO2_02_FULL_40_15]